MVAHAARLSFSAVALTDHDTVEGCARGAAAAQAAEIEFICGLELTAEWDGHEVHLLGYFIDPLHHSRASGRLPRNLDGWMLGAETNRERFAAATSDADVAVIEGVMGLYDGSEGKSGGRRLRRMKGVTPTHADPSNCSTSSGRGTSHCTWSTG